MKQKYALYIGRWQTWHEGHEWLIQQQLDKGKHIWIAIRNVTIDENNPKSAAELVYELRTVPFIQKHTSKILITVIPDIESVNYGRGVGYDVVYHEPPDEIKKISGTEIRKNS